LSAESGLYLLINKLGGGWLKDLLVSNKLFRSWQKLKRVVLEEAPDMYEDLRL